jgi:PhzF family phenazine biosynthesis protein
LYDQKAVRHRWIRQLIEMMHFLLGTRRRYRDTLAMLRRFSQLDVFTDKPLLGNPLAVVVDAAGLSTDQMQAFARWTNLSETTFLLEPTDSSADYRVRIFTPVEELPFAGHPTLGSAYAWLSHGGLPKKQDFIVQECGVGLIRVRQDDTILAFEAPSLLRGGPAGESDILEAANALGIDRSSIIDSAWVDNGPGWLGILLSSADEVLSIKPRAMDLTIGVVGSYPTGSPYKYEVRAFYSKSGVTLEDPVTGSLHASLAQWLIETGRVAAPYRASQGTALGRAGVVHISADESGSVWVGGDVVSCVEGTVDI